MESSAVTSRSTPMTEVMRMFYSVLAAGTALLMVNIAFAAFLYTVFADRLDQLAATVATKDELAVLAANVATKDELAALAANVATKDELAALAATVATKDELAVLAATTATKFDELDARVALGSVFWDPDTPILTSDSKTESDLLYFGPKPEGKWSAVLRQFAQESGVNVQRVDPSYDLLDYLRAQGASSIPDSLKTPLDLE